jgi:citrate synthase
MATERKATLTVPGETPVHFPVIVPTHGRDCLDIRTLGTRTGRFAYDSGFESTASCKSKITFIDGQQGELLYRGYPVEQLARHCDFLEVACLLKNGELPDARQKQAFDAAIRKNASVHEQMVKFYQGFRRDARPMSVMVGVVGALSAFHHEAADFSDAEERNLSFHRIVARMPTIVAMAYKYSIGEPFMSPRHDLGYAANFLYMMFATPREAFRPNPVLVRALDRLLIVHAEYGQDASTSTVRMAGSSGANPFACVSAAIASLSGPAHGGASEACLAQLAAIGDVSCVAQFVARARDESDSFRLTGFGPRCTAASIRGQSCCAKCATRSCPNSGWRIIASSRWPGHLKKLRSRIPISSSTNSTQTSTSIPASCRRHSAFHPRCSPAPSPSPARLAGWHTGKKCWTMRNSRSPARASSTPV